MSDTYFNRIPNLDYYGEGDFFDFIPLGSETLVAAVLDASVTGLGARILMSGVQSMLRAFTAARRRTTLSSVAQELNRAVYGISPDIFFPTLFCARIDPQRGRLQYVSAGHETALLIRKDARRVDRLERTGTVLGLTARSTYTHRTLPLEPGDILVAFTDGVAECEANIVEAIRRRPSDGASSVVGRIVDAASGHPGERTVIAVRYTGAMAQGAWEERACDAALAAA